MTGRTETVRGAGAAKAVSGTPAAQLRSFLVKYSPEVAAVARDALAAMRRLVPGATELVYDNYNALAIGFGPSERASDIVFSLAVYPRWVSLFFMQSGPTLPDPTKVLRGGGRRVRHLMLTSAADLNRSDVRDLIQRAQEAAETPIDPGAKRRLVIASVSARQRPRRPAPRVSTGTAARRRRG